MDWTLRPLRGMFKAVATVKTYCCTSEGAVPLVALPDVPLLIKFYL